jgi:DNA-binding NarL/FixJ family response regulator
LTDLTDREIDVFRLAPAASPTPTSHELVVAASTIETHVSKILAKLDIHDRRACDGGLQPMSGKATASRRWLQAVRCRRAYVGCRLPFRSF